MLFWNGNDYQNNRFIYNYFVQNVLKKKKKNKTFWLVLSSAIVLAACDDKPKMTEQTKTTDQEKVTIEQPAHQLKNAR